MPIHSPTLCGARRIAATLALALSSAASAEFPSFQSSVEVTWTDGHPGPIADFDGDGDLDVLVVRPTDVLLWRRTDAGFVPDSVPSPLVADAWTMRTPDLDGDGDRDLLWSTAGNGVATALNDGSGVFAPGSAGAPLAIAFGFLLGADLDGDGDDDPVHVSRTGVIDAWMRRGDGELDAPITVGRVSTPILMQIGTAGAADLDGDGDDDLVVVSKSVPAAFVFLAQPDGTLFGPIGLPLPRGGTQVLLHDLDGDGNVDAAISLLPLAWDMGIQLFRGRGDGRLEHWTCLQYAGWQYPLETNVNVAPALAAGDLDGDGDQDLVTRERYDLRLFLQDEANSWTEGALAPGAIFDGSPPAVADLDGDGLPELLTTSDWPNAIVVNQNDGAGGFAAGQATGASLGSLLGTTTGDFDGDGHDDLLAPGLEPGSLLRLDGSAGGMMADPLVLADQEIPYAQRTPADLDGDGALDFVAARSGQPVTWFRNDGTGVFTGRVIGEPDLSGSTFAIGDLDTDGDLDVAMATNAAPMRVAWNQGDGGFVTAWLDTVASALPMAAGDLDGDLRTDLVIEQGSSLLVLRNEGAGSLVPLKPWPATSESRRSVVGISDLDGDGTQDVLMQSLTSDFVWRLRAYFGDRETGIGAEAILIDDERFGPFRSADLDGDDDLDLLAFTKLGAFAVPLENVGRWTFAAPAAIAGGAAFYDPDLHLLDVDGDGDDDLLVASVWDEGVFVHLNLRCPPDLDGDGAVAFADLLALLDAWGGEGGPADLDRDGSVGTNDLLRLLAQWGPCRTG